MNAFLSSQFEYCPLVWMSHNLSLINRINKLQESALRVVHENTFTVLYITTHHRNIQKRAIKMNNHIVYGMIIYAEHTMLKLYNMRLKQSFMGPRRWSLVPSKIKTSEALEIFNQNIRYWKADDSTYRLCKTYIKRPGYL